MGSVLRHSVGLALVVLLLAACGGGSAATPTAAAPVSTPLPASVSPSAPTSVAATSSAPSPTTTPAPTLLVVPMTYTGTTDGGGTVSFTLSPDGAKVTAFDAKWPACPQGTFHVNFANLGITVVAISAGKFTFGAPTFATITGQLLANRTAEGTLTDACKGVKPRTWHATGTATPAASAAPAGPPATAAASGTFKTGKAAVKVTFSGTVLSLAEPLGSGEVGGNRLSASWDDRVKGGGLIGTQLKLELPAVSGTYANSTGGFEGVFITIKHLAIASETDEQPSQSCHVVIDPTSTGGIAGTLDCTGTSPTQGSYKVRGTFSVEP
jgi:hypothetical protein